MQKVFSSYLEGFEEFDLSASRFIHYDSNNARRLRVVAEQSLKRQVVNGESLQRIHFSLLTSHFFPPPGTPVALMRAARDGSMPSVTFTVIPGFKSAMLARCPFTVISVNCVIVSVLVVFLSLTVIALPVTLEMTGW